MMMMYRIPCVPIELLGQFGKMFKELIVSPSTTTSTSTVRFLIPMLFWDSLCDLAVATVIIGSPRPLHPTSWRANVSQPSNTKHRAESETKAIVHVVSTTLPLLLRVLNETCKIFTPRSGSGRYSSVATSLVHVNLMRSSVWNLPNICAKPSTTDGRAHCIRRTARVS